MTYTLQWLKSQMNLYLHSFAIVPFFFFLYILHKLLFNTTPTKKNLPPSPTKLPIVGNLHQIDNKLPHRSLQDLAKHYGEIMLLQFGQKPVLVVSSAKAAYEILKTQDIIFADRPALSTFKKLLYNCKDVATAPYGNYWRMIRSVCVNQLLNYSRVQAFRNVREEETAYMMEEINKSRGLVNLTKRLSTFATDVICRAAFGVKFSGERDGINFKDLILDMFVAGSTTTFATLEWAMSELLINPRVMERLKEEVMGITRGKASITETDLEKMEYLKAIIKETFRLHPPVPLLLPRISAQETQLQGYDIPVGTQVIINAWAIHRDPAFWKEPEKFTPERFLNSPIDFRGQHFDLIPFGSGRRGCPGILFGTANIELVLANLVKKFDWALPEGKTLDMAEYPGISMHRNKPLLVVATPT